MRHGYVLDFGSYAGWEYGQISFGVIAFIITVTALILILSRHFGVKKPPEINRLLETVKTKYATNEISADEFRERSMILDDNVWWNSNNPEMAKLNELYAACAIDSREYVIRRDEICGSKDPSSLQILRERFAKGEINLEEFNKIRKAIL